MKSKLKVDCEVIHDNTSLKFRVRQLRDDNKELKAELKASKELCDELAKEDYKEYEKLKVENELLKADNPKFAQFLKSNGIVQGDDGEVECAECEVFARLKEVEGRVSKENIEKVYNDMKDKQYPCLFKFSDYSKVLSADILRKGEM